MSVALALALATALSGPAPAGPLPQTGPAKDRIVMSQAPQGSRPPPPRLQPVTRDGVRYEEDMESSRHGGTGRGGYLVATNAATGERLWSVEVYHVPAAGPGAPGETSRHFRSLSPARDGAAVAIEDEAGGRYLVDLATRTVTVDQAPPSGEAAPPPQKPKPKP